MRHFPLSAMLLCTVALLAACAGVKTPEQSVKNAALLNKQDVTLKLAHAKEESADIPGAEKLFQQLADQSPSAPEPRAELAEFYRRHHQDQKAIANFKAALALEPNNPVTARSLANTYIGAGEPGMALPLLQKAIAANPADPLLYNSRGVADDQLGNYAQAQQSYKMAYDLDPVGGTVYKINISMSYILSGRYDKAIAMLRPMLDMPDAPPNVRQNLALAYGMKGDSDSALKLGLQDLTASEAEENLRFYRMLAHKHPSSHASSAAPQEVPASVVRELFPEGETDTAPSGSNAIPITIEPVTRESAKESPAAIPAIQPAKPQDAPSSPASPVRTAPGETALPEPVLKPDVL